MDVPRAFLAIALFGGGAVVVVWSTERLLSGMVGIATLARIAPFAVSAVLSGLEAENVAVGLVAAHHHNAELALGTVFGGGTFIVSAALGLGALLYPISARLPKEVLAMMALSPVLAGTTLIGSTLPRAGGLLLVAFLLAMARLVLSSRRHQFTEVKTESRLPTSSWPVAIGLTVLGIVVVTVGGELVTAGAIRMVAVFGIPVGIMGMIVTPAVIEAEEVIRQAIPAKEGRPEVSAGNAVGTLLYFALFNLGLIALLAPVRIPPLTRTLDWPFLVGTTWLATAFLARGRVGRVEGLILLLAYVAYVALHVVLA
jgi:cation:H+ antiporter